MIRKLLNYLVLSVPLLSFLPLYVSVAGVNIYLIDIAIISSFFLLFAIKRITEFRFDILILLSILFISVLLSALVNSAYGRSIFFLIRIAEGIILIIAASYINLSIDKIKKAFIYSGIVFSIYLSINKLLYGIEFVTLYGGTNGIFLGLTVILLILNDQLFKRRQWVLFFIVILVISMVLDGRRSTFIGLFVVLFFFFIYKKTLRTVYITSVVFILSYIFILNFDYLIPEESLRKLTELTDSGNITEVDSFQMRLNKWTLALNIIISNIWFGVGEGNVFLGLKRYVVLGNERPDNMYVAIAIIYGIFVLIAFLLYVIRAAVLSYYSKNSKDLFYSIVYIFIFGVTWAFYANSSIYMLFYMVFVISVVKNRETVLTQYRSYA